MQVQGGLLRGRGYLHGLQELQQIRNKASKLHNRQLCRFSGVQMQRRVLGRRYGRLLSLHGMRYQCDTLEFVFAW